MAQPDSNSAFGRKQSITLCVLAFFLLLFSYAPFISGQKDFVIVDCQYTYQPIAAFIHKCLLHSWFPFWNPHNYGGFSQLAVSSPGIFYPFNYLFFLLPFSCGEGIYLLLHQFIAGVAAFAFTLQVLKSRAAAAFACLSTIFCGYLFSCFKYPDFTAAIAFFLCALASSAYFFRETAFKQAIALLFFFISAALLYLSGRPELFIPGTMLLFLYTSIELYSSYKVGSPQKRNAFLFLFWLIFLLAGLLLSAPMLLPIAEWSSLSSRAGGLGAGEVFTWSTCWQDWFSMIFFEPFGDLDRPGSPIGAINNIFQSEGQVTMPFLSSSYMGPAFFSLLIFGCLDESFKMRCLFVSLAIFAGIVSAGDQTPVAPMLLSVFPKLAVLRYPLKGVIFSILPCIVLAAQGYSSLFDSRTFGQKRLYFLLVLWTGVLLLGPALFYSKGFASFLNYLCLFCHAKLDTSVFYSTQESLFFSFSLTGALGLAFVISCWLYRKGLLREQPFAILSLSISILPMFFYGMYLQNKAAPGGYYEAEPALSQILRKTAKDIKPGSERIANIIENPLFATKDYLLKQNTPYFLSIEHLGRDVLSADTHFSSEYNFCNGYALAETAQVDKLFSLAVARSKLESAEKSNAVYSDFPLARFFALTCTSYVLTKDSSLGNLPVAFLDKNLFDLLQVDSSLNVRIYRVRNIGSRLYFASRIKAVDSWLRLSSEYADARNLFLVNDDLTFIHNNDLSALKKRLEGVKADPLIKMSELSIVHEEPGFIQISMQKKEPGLLVLRDQYYPGWHCKIDKTEVPILKANLFNRAVPVPSGKHSIEFVFDPDSLRVGLALSLMGLLLAVMGSFAFLALRRKFGLCS